jgi:hypothetical protein
MRHRWYSRITLAAAALAVVAWSVNPVAAQKGGGHGGGHGGGGGGGHPSGGSWGGSHGDWSGGHAGWDGGHDGWYGQGWNGYGRGGWWWPGRYGYGWRGWRGNWGYYPYSYAWDYGYYDQYPDRYSYNLTLALRHRNPTTGTSPQASDRFGALSAVVSWGDGCLLFSSSDITGSCRRGSSPSGSGTAFANFN